MRTYTFTTTLSPMDDADLAANFKNMRRKFWIRQDLWIPEDVTVVFGKIKKHPTHGKPYIAYFNGSNKITIMPEMAHVYVAVHTALLHEMAHLYVAVKYQDDRRAAHGKTFHDEIDRLYALGAFRELI